MTDFYLAFHITTTSDSENNNNNNGGLYTNASSSMNTTTSKDSSEIIELAWSLIDATTLQELHHDSTLVKPINTPITPYCTNLTTLTWDHVKDAGSLKDAINKLDLFLKEHVMNKNLEFSFVTLNSWDLRMKLPKESRERSIMLPPYLELSRYFDLKKEFAKWQESMHPEYPRRQPLNSISMNQMIVQLDIDLSEPGVCTGSDTDNGSGENTTTTATPYHINSPKRATDEVKIMVKILKALAQQQQQSQNKSAGTILTQPHDSHLDLKQFFQEKSKILYMSNLPVDTTQSELESWFTQFGGRPIAFWTLKSNNSSTSNDHHGHGNGHGNGHRYGNNKKTNMDKQQQQQQQQPITGFAIFATHDEAVDSLSMNGRTLNDRIIEVQPSSIRVLDRSQEILISFPSSKNRPRPGDWTCPSCGFSNFQRRTACFRCSFPAASAAAIQDSMYSGGNNITNNKHHGHSHGHSHGHGQRHQQYNNLQAQYAAFALAQQAAAQQPPQQAQQQVQQAQQIAALQQQVQQQQSINGLMGDMNGHFGGSNTSFNNSNGHNQFQQYNNFNGNTTGMRNNNLSNNNNNNNNNNNTSSVPFRAGDWKCEQCTYHNFAKNICCLKCGSPRTTSNTTTTVPMGAIGNGNNRNKSSQFSSFNNNGNGGNNPQNNLIHQPTLTQQQQLQMQQLQQSTNNGGGSSSVYSNYPSSVPTPVSHQQQQQQYHAQHAQVHQARFSQSPTPTPISTTGSNSSTSGIALTPQFMTTTTTAQSSTTPSTSSSELLLLNQINSLNLNNTLYNTNSNNNIMSSSSKQQSGF